MVSELTSEYFKVPNDIHLICEDVYEHAILIYLLRFANGTNKHPIVSINGLRMKGLISAQKVITVTKSLERKGYISHKQRNYRSNEYTIYLDKILKDIRSAQSNKEVGEKATQEYNEQQKDIMAARRVAKNQKLLAKVAKAQGKLLIDELTSEILN